MDIHSLEQILTENLTWNQSRIKFLSRFLIALFQVQTVNLAKNALMLAVAYKGVSIPLFWIVLDEKGCSDNLERQQILEQFIDEFGAESIRLVPADREFASKDWIDYLVTKKIEFQLRKTDSGSEVVSDIEGRGQRIEFSGKRHLWNQALYVAVCCKAGGDHVIIISSE